MRTFSVLSRKCFLLVMALFLTGVSGCATAPVESGREWVRPAYRERIQEWQMRIRKDGWTESRLDSILSQFRELAVYKMEIQDHWDTPKEFAKKDFAGDCEDIVVYMISTLKQLGYPYGIRLLVVRTLFEEHALLKVETPQGGWKTYDVVPASVVKIGETEFLKPVVEFDEKAVVWYPPPVEATPLARAVARKVEARTGETARISSESDW